MEPVIGIDLGTTYSAVATVENGRPVIIPSRGGQRLTPSVVGIAATGERVIGQRAVALADEAPGRVAPATKRYVGKRWSPELAAAARGLVPYPLVAGPATDVRIRLAGRVMPLTQVAAMILGELKLDAEAHFGRPVTKCVVTVPANFDDGQRQATREAARIAGLDVLRIVNEPTAAAIGYGLQTEMGGRALVFDLGGGTLDVTVLEVQEGVFQVKATGGDEHLGGEDFDSAIVRWLLAQVPTGQRDLVGKDAISMQRLRSAAERAKRALTEQPEVAIGIADLGVRLGTGESKTFSMETVLTRTFFETLVEPLTAKCVDVCRAVLKDAQLQGTDVQSLLLVGGMTRVPVVRRLISELLGREPAAGLNPDEAVALGAAVHAHELARKAGETVLIDVAAHSLSVGMLGGRVRTLIPRNATVPAVAKGTFLPSQSGQRVVRLPIYQGEGPRADQCVKLGELVLANLSGKERSDVAIEVTFELSCEAILSARAVDTTTGMAEALRIEARTTLSSAEVARLSAEQANYASEQGQVDRRSSTEAFQRLLEGAERTLQALERGASEQPSAEADAVVERAKDLVTKGRALLQEEDVAQMAALRSSLEQLATLG